jgi:hypothetical protein
VPCRSWPSRARTGRVFYNSAEPGHVVPLPDVMRPDPGPEPWGRGATLLATQANFNLDLRAHLSLPPNQAAYTIFVWLDDVTSTVQTASLPGGPDPLPPGVKGSTASVHFRHSKASPPAAGSGLSLRWQGAEPAQNQLGPQIFGSIGPALIPAKGVALAERPRLTVLALGYRSRRFAWQSVDLPDEVLSTQNCSYDLPLRQLFDPEKPREKIFVLACFGRTLSRVLTVDADKAPAAHGS